MNRINKLILTVFIGCLMMASKCWAQQPDSVLVEVEDNPYAIKKGKQLVSPTDSAINAQLTERVKSQTSAMDYVLDKRYRAEGDSMDSHWYDNLHLQVGAGFEQMVAPSDDYRFNAVAMPHLGVGLQLNRLNTLRLLLHGGMALQRNDDHLFARIGLRMDHLFDLTSYLNGYQPTRFFSVSTMIGIGRQYAHLTNSTSQKGYAWEGHGGLQMRFYTGPHGYLNIEPYIGAATNNYDLGVSQNWRKYDFFYGIQANYVYYFSNHLSRVARQREIEKAKQQRKGKDVLTDDSLRSLAWQTPWFAEFSMGANVVRTPGMRIRETLGSTATISVGKWFSPVIGLRASAIMRNAGWLKEREGRLTTRQNTYNLSGGLEAMFNPFGLSNRFSWDGKMGAYLLVGGELGWQIKERTESHYKGGAYTAGVHLWLRLADGLRIFMEPRYNQNIYLSSDWNHHYSEKSLGLNVGLTTTQIAPKYRKIRKVNPDEDQTYRMTIGFGGGLSIMPKISNVDVYQGVPFNFGAHAIYHFNHVSGLRLGLDYMALPAVDNTAYIDYSKGQASVTKHGLWKHTYYVGQATLAYHINLTNICAGYRQDRLFNMEAYAGGGLYCLLGELGRLSGSESLPEGHQARLAKEVKASLSYVAIGGVTLSARLSPQLSLVLMPQISYMPNLNLPAVNQSRLKIVENINIGVQYHF